MSDAKNKGSMLLGRKLLEALGPIEELPRLGGQTAGNRFEVCVHTFLSTIFPHLKALRRGKFSVERGQSIERFDQYEHLAKLVKISNSKDHKENKETKELRLVLGTNYLVKPDIVIARAAETDDDLNYEGTPLVDATAGRRSSIRARKGRLPTLHASISCKWTMRSDRAQNARTEALNMIRHRKGRLPHITVVTAEADPAIIASLAIGTADLDCVYHIALDELGAAVTGFGSDKAKRVFDDMVDGHRLRDIADLPLDLTV